MLSIPSRPGVLDPRGWATYRHGRGGRVLESGRAPNMVTTEGKTDLLNVLFGGQSSLIDTGYFWLIGLVDHAGSPTFSASDTMASHPGWSEFTAYGPNLPDNLSGFNATWRAFWYRHAPSGTSILGDPALASSGVTLAFTADATIHGIFVTTGTDRGSTSGALWATASFGSPLSALAYDWLELTYSISL